VLLTDWLGHGTSHKCTTAGFSKLPSTSVILVTNVNYLTYLLTENNDDKNIAATNGRRNAEKNMTHFAFHNIEFSYNTANPISNLYCHIRPTTD